MLLVQTDRLLVEKASHLFANLMGLFVEPPLEQLRKPICEVDQVELAFDQFAESVPWLYVLV